MKKSVLGVLAAGFLLLAPTSAGREKKVEIQNYPNPFDQKTKIEYVLEDSTEVTLVVLDSYYNELDTLVWRKMQAPDTPYVYTFDATGKPTGTLNYYRTGTQMDVYWYQLRSRVKILAHEKMFKNSR